MKRFFRWYEAALAALWVYIGIDHWVTHTPFSVAMTVVACFLLAMFVALNALNRYIVEELRASLTGLSESAVDLLKALGERSGRTFPARPDSGQS